MPINLDGFAVLLASDSLDLKLETQTAGTSEISLLCLWDCFRFAPHRFRGSSLFPAAPFEPFSMLLIAKIALIRRADQNFHFQGRDLGFR